MKMAESGPEYLVSSNRRPTGDETEVYEALLGVSGFFSDLAYKRSNSFWFPQILIQKHIQVVHLILHNLIPLSNSYYKRWNSFTALNSGLF